MHLYEHLYFIIQYYRNLAPTVTEEHLHDLFSPYGDINSVKVMWPRTDEEKQRQRNSGFVSFMHRRDAEDAKSDLQDYTLEDKKITVSWGKAVKINSSPFLLPPPKNPPLPLQGMPPPIPPSLPPSQPMAMASHQQQIPPPMPPSLPSTMNSLAPPPPPRLPTVSSTQLTNNSLDQTTNITQPPPPPPLPPGIAPTIQSISTTTGTSATTGTTTQSVMKPPPPLTQPPIASKWDITPITQPNDPIKQEMGPNDQRLQIHVPTDPKLKVNENIYIADIRSIIFSIPRFTLLSVFIYSYLIVKSLYVYSKCFGLIDVL